MTNNNYSWDDVLQDNQNYTMSTYDHFDVVLQYGKNATVYDLHGTCYIDFTSGIGVNSLGYADPAWANAISQQAQTLQHTSNLYLHAGQSSLSQKICTLTHFARAFWCNSGAEANECAIKLARKYSLDRYGMGRHTILSLHHSFHGRTISTLAATGQSTFHQFFFPFTEGFVHVHANDLQDVLKHMDDRVCAVWIELIQGEGGVLPLSYEFVHELARLCQEHDVLLMVDEVQTGVGRTGRLYAYEHYDIQPDIITSAKGLGSGMPIGACLCTEKLAHTLGHGTHGSTFGGNPLACAAAHEVLDRISPQEFLMDVQQKGDYFREQLLKMPHVQKVRGMGLMLGVLTDHHDSKQLASRCVQQGVLVLTAKEALRLLPPLTISYSEIDQGLAALEQALREG